MRTWMAVSVVVSLLAVLGCQSEPAPVPVSSVETVVLKIPFEETQTDTEGAKRVVVCQFGEGRAQPMSLGEAVSPGGDRIVRKFMAPGDLTWVMPKVLGGYLKRVGLNVSYSERLETFEGDVLRDLLSRHSADYVVAGRLEQFDVRVLAGEGRPALALIALRLDVYNKDGRLRIYFPAPFKRAGMLGEDADDVAAVTEFVNGTIAALFETAFEDAGFVETLDLDLATVRELMKAKPAPPVDTMPETTEPVEPAEPTEAEKAEAERLRKARELEGIINQEKERRDTEPK